MSPKNETAVDLREQKKEVELRIKELITLRDSMSVVITHVEGTGVQTELATIVEDASISDGGIGLTGFVRGLFQSSPNKTWTIMAIRSESEVGNFVFNGKFLNESIYSVLSRLEKKKEIRKGGALGKRRWYKKLETVKAI